MSKNITRADLAQAVFLDLGLSYSESEKLVEAVFEEIIQAFERGEGVKLTTFGSFNLKQKDSRMGRNPRTGEEYEIEKHQTISFVPSQNLKSEVKGASLKEDNQ